MKPRQLAGWAGVALILVAYVAVTLELLHPKDLLYSLINLIGATGIIISSYAKKDFQPVFLNVVWLLVALTGLIKSLL